MRGDSPFSLVKWYFDCEAADGRVAIAYWAQLAWRRLAVTWQSIVLYEPGNEPVRRSTLVAAPPPVVSGDSLAWRAEALGCAVHVESRQRPIEARLLDADTGVVDWRVEAPAAQVSVALAGFAPVRGPGYAERIIITVPPWRLPIRELRWGRWLDASPDRSVVWIDWAGESPRTWVFVDGDLAPSAVVTDERISAGAVSVTAEESRTLEDFTFSRIASTIPGLEAVVPKSILALRQVRWSSVCTLRDGDAAPLIGRAIHEAATFR